MYIDMPLNKLLEYKPEPEKQPDFDAFWQETLADSARTPLEPEFTRLDYPVENIDLYRATFNGFRGTTRVHCWCLVPNEGLRRSKGSRVPGIAVYHGYSGSKGRPASYLHWALQGYVVL